MSSLGTVKIATPSNTGGTVPTATGSAPASLAGIGATPATPGYAPDWSSLIANDPGLLASEGALGAAGTANLAQRNAEIKSAYIAYGGNIDIPTLAKQMGLSEADITNALGPDAQTLAQQNTDAGLSTTARLNQANTDALQSIRANLNKRGLLNSGETGYQLNRQDLSYRQAQFDATQKILGVLQQYQSGYLSAEQAREEALAAAFTAAAGRVQQSNPSVPGTPAQPGETANFVGVDINHDPVYQTSSGAYYDQNGDPYTGYRQQNYGTGNTVAIGAFK